MKKELAASYEESVRKLRSFYGENALLTSEDVDAQGRLSTMVNTLQQRNQVPHCHHIY